VIAVITNPNSTDASEELRDVQNAARATGEELVVVAATSNRDFEAAFAVIVQRRAQALLISTDPFLVQSTDRIIALAAQHRIPAVYATSESVAGGGLISYGASISNAWRLAGVYARAPRVLSPFSGQVQTRIRRADWWENSAKEPPDVFGNAYPGGGARLIP
jgi:putative ABC transport system substrate-binding protein